MRRRGFFGVLAGIFGAPVVAGAVTVTKNAAEAFAEPIPESKPLARERQENEDWRAATTMCTVASCTSYRSTQWDDGIIICKYCKGKEFRDYMNCRHCGAPT